MGIRGGLDALQIVTPPAMTGIGNPDCPARSLASRPTTPNGVIAWGTPFGQNVSNKELIYDSSIVYVTG